MAAIKISSKVDARTWEALKAHAEESQRNIAGLLTEAIDDYLARRRVRPEVLKHLDASLTENAELGRLLAR